MNLSLSPKHRLYLALEAKLEPPKDREVVDDCF